eukprot:Tbor_TRINITY_DN5487_c3_g1::TRINITY_DN5487_c3_g1_i1::g.24169::m.24169
MNRPLISDNNDSSHHMTTYEDLDNNINGLPITEHKLRELFNDLDINKNGILDFVEVKKFYNSFDNFGLECTDKEITAQVNKYTSNPNVSFTFDEFCCLMLSIVQR